MRPWYTTKFPPEPLSHGKPWVLSNVIVAGLVGTIVPSQNIRDEGLTEWNELEQTGPRQLL